MKEINVAVTGGAGQISYSLLPRLISGETFGPDTKVNLRLVEIPQVVDKLEGTIMELIDCGFDQTGSLLATADIKEGVDGANWVLLVGSIPRGIVVDGKKIEERSDLLRINGGIFTDQGSAIGELANKDAKILVLDEATSALDTKTESAVMEAVEDLSRELTIVMIAHRLTTVMRCDRLIRLDKGLIIQQGSPDQVLMNDV